VAAGILPAVEGGILPPGKCAGSSSTRPAGQDAQLYGSQDDCRYARAAVVVPNIPTNIRFFDRSGPTREVRYDEQPLSKSVPVLSWHPILFP
jgi:hypothetical protein